MPSSQDKRTQESKLGSELIGKGLEILITEAIKLKREDLEYSLPFYFSFVVLVFD